MKCPLQGFEGSRWGGIEKVEAVDCIEEECARWDDARNCCIDITIGDALEGIMINLNRIEEKMSHEG